MDLLNKKCVPCEGGTNALTRDEANAYLSQTSKWLLDDDAKKISREFTFPSGGGSTSGGKSPFQQAIAFVNKVADIAEAEGHHPDLHVFYGRVRIELWTHAVGGLSENDFILAAKINALQN